MKKNLRNLTEDERLELIDLVARRIAKKQGWNITLACRLDEAENPRIRQYASTANAAIKEIEKYLLAV